jgi:3-hydroxybutyryl-CoA dehydrogenase/5-formyl-3-hydroxy-2-methylpyridine 4-carboxylate dehydrogenase
VKAAVIGLGTMGPGMAATLARGGIDVRCQDVSAEQLQRAANDLETALQVLERIGGPAAERRGTVGFDADLAAAVRDADLVIEAVPERLALKQQVFAELDRVAPARAILASNTSGIPITKLQEAVARKDRVVGMHWSNPPHVIPVIEVIAGNHTSAATVDATRQIVTGLGLLPVVVRKDVPGFVQNRVLYAIMRECVSLVEKGVISPDELDTCVKWGIGFKLAVIGPMELLDVAGLDIYEAVAGYLNADLDNAAGVPSFITTRTRERQLGMKTGRGIYEYTPERIQALRAARAAKLVATRKTLEGR